VRPGLIASGTVTANIRRFVLVARCTLDVDVKSVAAATPQPAGSRDHLRHIGTVVLVAEQTAPSVFERSSLARFWPPCRDRTGGWVRTVNAYGAATYGFTLGF